MFILSCEFLYFCVIGLNYCLAFKYFELYNFQIFFQSTDFKFILIALNIQTTNLTLQIFLNDLQATKGILKLISQLNLTEILLIQFF